ncbi:hypothetical protein [Streptomyces mutabilis]|uniref:hypothetical protein n=1 Tax=Streptomyces mutabilis TaxID=67332 RepID=UPI003F698A6D
MATTTVAGAAAPLAGRAFVDFTPSTGARPPALDELAREQGVPCVGGEGKTGEALVKSVLAPMFSRRALLVRSHRARPGGAVRRPGRPGALGAHRNGSSAHAHSIRGR